MANSRGLSAKQIRCLLREVPKHLPKTDDGKYVFIFEPTSDEVIEHFHFHFADAIA